MGYGKISSTLLNYTGQTLLSGTPLAGMGSTILGSYGSGFVNPASIPGLMLWLNAGNTGSIIQSGGNVSAWNDLSTNGNNFTQSNGALQPIYNASVINGQPGINFKNAGNIGCMVSSAGLELLGTGASPFTIWCVCQPVAAQSFAVIGSFYGGGSSNDPQLSFSTATNYTNLFFGAKLTGTFGTVRSSTSFGYGTTTSYMPTITYNGGGPGFANYAFYASNVSQTVVNAGDDSDTVAGTITVLGANSAAGDSPLGYLCEIAIYNSALNSTNLANLQSYGNTKYGL